jgi:hypothetical protein
MTRAIDHARSAGAPIPAVTYQLHLGRIRGDAEGKALQARAGAELRAHGVARPERWANIYACGFGRDGD